MTERGRDTEAAPLWEVQGFSDGRGWLEGLMGPARLFPSVLHKVSPDSWFAVSPGLLPSPHTFPGKYVACLIALQCMLLLGLRSTQSDKDRA